MKTLLIFLVALLLTSPLFAQQASIREVENVAALAGQVQDLNRTRFVKGYYLGGDGGGGFFVFTNTITSTNLGTRFRVTGQAYSWERQHDGRVNVRWFGALASSGDDSARIQAALDYASSNRFSTYIPSGQFKIQTTISLPNSAVLTGDGNGSELVLTGLPKPVTVQGVTNITVSKLKFSGAYSHGIYMNLSTNVTVRDCDWSGCTIASGGADIASCINADVCNDIKISGNTFHDNGSASVSITFAGLNLVADGNWIFNSAYGILSSGQTNSFLNNRIRSSGGSGITVLGGDNALISGNDVYGAPIYGIYLDSFSTNCLITGNRIYGNTVAAIHDLGGFNTIVNNTCVGGAIGIDAGGDSGLILPNVSVAQTTGLQLTGSRYRVDPLGRYDNNAIPINDPGGNIIKTITTGTTPSVRDAAVYLLNYATPTVITDFIDGQIGMRRTFLGNNTNAFITNNASLRLDSASFIQLKDGDTLVLERGASGNWRQVGRSINTNWMHYDRSLEKMLINAPSIHQSTPSIGTYQEEHLLSTNTTANALLARWAALGNSDSFAIRMNGTTATRFTIDGIDYLYPRTNALGGQILASDGASPQQLYWANQTNAGGTLAAYNFGPQFDVSANTNINLAPGLSTTNQNMAGNVTSGTINLGSKSGAFTIDAGAASEFNMLLSGNATVTITNFSDFHNFNLTLTNAGNFSLTFADTMYWMPNGNSTQATNDWGAGVINRFPFWKTGGRIIADGKVGLGSAGISVPISVPNGGTGRDLSGGFDGVIPFFSYSTGKFYTAQLANYTNSMFWEDTGGSLGLAHPTATGAPLLRLFDGAGVSPLMYLYGNAIVENNDDLRIGVGATYAMTLQVNNAHGIRLTKNLSTVIGDGTTTTTRTNKFIYIPTTAGVPTGVPAIEQAGTVAMDYNTSANHLYVYNAGWQQMDAAGGITGLANPSATLGLTAINGTATTAMRSDGAPALNVTIAPTWTGLHTFQRPGLGAGATAVDVLIENPSTATTSAQYWSPQLALRGNGWNDTTSSAGRVGAYEDVEVYKVVNGAAQAKLRWTMESLPNFDPVMALSYQPDYSHHANLVVGHQTLDMATTNVQGFIYLPSMAGTPTGTPIAEGTFLSPITYDRTNHKLYAYDTAWRDLTGAGGGSGSTNGANWVALGTTNSQLYGESFVNRSTSTNGFFTGAASYDAVSASLVNNGGNANVLNNSAVRLSSLSLKGGLGAETFLQFFSGNALRGSWDTNGILNAYYGSRSDNTTVTNGITALDIPTNSLLRVNENKKLAPVVIGSGIGWDGTNLTATGTGGSGSTNWHDLVGTNSALYGDAFVNRITATNGVTAGSGSSAGTFTATALNLLNNGGSATVANNSSARLSILKLVGGTGSENSIDMLTANVRRVIIESNGVVNVMVATKSAASVVTNSSTIGMGTSGSFARVGGVAFIYNTSIGNTGASEVDLMTYPVTGGMLAVDKDTIRVRCAGGFAANGNNKRIRVYFGAALLFDSGSQAFNNNFWIMSAEIIRVDGTSQMANVTWNSDSTLLSATATLSLPTETLSGTVVFKVTGQGTSSLDLYQRSEVVEFLPTPP